MKQIEMNKALFDTCLGLSCVENYLLYILSFLNFDFKSIYAKSYVTISAINHALYNEKIQYAYFDKIPRLHSLLCDLGIVRISNSENIEAILSCNSYCCIQVDDRIINERYDRKFWRDDHYLLVSGSKKDKYILLNDVPRDIFEIDKQQLIEMFNGKSICFDILDTSVPEDAKEKLLNEFQVSLTLKNSACKFTIENLETARDVIGIIRVTRKRIREYCSLYMDANFMLDYISKIDRTYAMFEYMRLRRRADYDKINQSLTEIQGCDFEVIEKIKNIMEKNYGRQK